MLAKKDKKTNKLVKNRSFWGVNIKILLRSFNKY